MSSIGFRTGLCLLALGLALNLTGCGQKGALYLPDKARTVVRKTTPAPAPATPSTATPAEAATPNTTDPDKDKISPKPVQ